MQSSQVKSFTVSCTVGLLTISALLIVGCASPRFVPVIDPMPPQPHPPMGWNSWYAFGDNISDALIRQQADAMISTGMYQVGYNYINLDDGWQGYRDGQGIIHPNAQFPDMKSLADYLHSRGLKFGIYTSMGPKGCNGLVGSLGHEEEDVQTFLDWGVDFVKYDICDFQPGDSVIEWVLIHKMSVAIRSHETHPVVLSIVMLSSPWEMAPLLGVDMWRISEDAEDSFENMIHIADLDAPLARYASTTGWNDPDMLQIGRGAMTLDESRTHMTLWVMLAAPLLSSTDLRAIDPSDLQILTNVDAVAINQDRNGFQAIRVSHTSDLDVWVKTLTSGLAIAVINRGRSPMSYMVDTKPFGSSASRAYEVWRQQMVLLPRSFIIPAHSCILLRTS